MMSTFSLRPLNPTDTTWIEQFMTEHWGDSFVVVHGQFFYARDLPGFVALQTGEKVGLITYTITGDTCEIISLDSLRPGQGIGATLIEAVKTAARQNGCRRLCLTTTNDNLHALRFYQRRGLRLAALRPNAVEISRQYKSIPLLGFDDIPIRDEIELEMILTNTQEAL
jgi:GNAT superfamily N-acetyltransferase